MPWGRLDDALHQNAKVLSFSDKAFRLWVYSISYCNAKRHADPVGRLSEPAAQALCRLAEAKPATVAELVAKRGWELVDGGYLVHDFPDYGPPTDRTAAERQRRHRALTREGNGVSHGGVTRDGYAPVPGPVPVPMSSPPHEQETSRQQTRMAISRSPDAPLDDFEDWWLTYPRHVAKQPAHSAYLKRRAAGR